MDALAKLLTKIFDQGFRTPDWRHNYPPPVVSLEDFFDGNSQPESIAPNLPEHPGLDFFYDKLKRIRSHDHVADVLVNIYDLSDIIFTSDNGWPYAENIHILTSVDEGTLSSWANELLSDGAGEGWPYGESPFARAPMGPYKWWFLSWD